MAQQDLNSNNSTIKQVIGIGGVFIKAKNPQAQAKWYDEHLGTHFGKNLYCSLLWRDAENPGEIGRSEFCFFAENNDYFKTSTRQLMLNLRVANLSNVLEHLKKQGVTPDEKTDSFDYGKFGWVMDPEKTRIELWEPVEAGFGEDIPAAIEKSKNAERITGLGGVFVKCKDDKSIIDWYEKHFGLPFKHSSHMFEWRELDNESKTGQTVFAFFPSTTDYFTPSEKEFMINFRVRNLESLLMTLKKEGVKVMDKTEEYDYGKFGWIIDPEGNKIELWQPVYQETK